MRQEFFGRTEADEAVKKYRLKNSRGNEIVVSDYGCTLMELWLEDKTGRKQNVVLGYSDLEGYLRNTDFLGACVGRFGGYIKQGRIRLNGREYQLAITDGKNHLHGGKKGFDKYVWESCCEKNRICFFRTSPDGEENYPGNLKVQITYEFTDQDEIKLRYEAVSDQDTICNLTNHTYFNLDGRESQNILEHDLNLNAEWVQKNNADGISDIGLFSVKNTAFDFRTTKQIGKDMFKQDKQLSYGHGYDHNYYIGRSGEMKKAAVLYSPKSGIEMSIFTNQSGIQLYSGNYLSGCAASGGNNPYGKYRGVCLETQYCPSKAEQQKGILYPVLEAGEKYVHETIFRFAIRNEER